MSAVSVIEQVAHLPSLIDRAAAALSSARNAAEVLEAREYAGVVYDMAKRAGRLAKAKQAHDDLISAAFRAQADALEIEAGAKRRLADEYDAAQERGEVKANGGARKFTVPDQNSELPSAADIGLSRKDIHEARIIRDAEVAQPGIARRALDAMLGNRQEPTKAALREAVLEAARVGGRGPAASNRNPHYEAPTDAAKAWSHLYGTSRALAEWATVENVAMALRGRDERRDDQTANLHAIRRAAAILTSFVEKIDAR